MPARKTTTFLRLSCLAGLSAALLSGCTWLEEWDGGSGGSYGAKVQQPQPQAKLVQTADATWLAPPSPSDEKVVKLVPAPDETMLDTQRRLEKMEKQISDMRNDMSMIMPALTRMAGVQADMQNAMTASAQPIENTPPPKQDQVIAVDDPVAMEEGNHPEGIAPVPLLAPQAGTPAPGAIAAAPAASGKPVAVTPASFTPVATANGVRFGTHPDKVRMVIETSSPVNFTYDASGSLVTVNLPGTTWEGPDQEAVSGSPLVESYTAAPDGQGGTLVTVKLRKSGKIIWAQALPAGGKSPRVVVDIAAQ